MLHRHGETLPVCHGLWATGGEVQPASTADSNLLCTACQIVQAGAVQPASAAQIIPSSVSVPLLRRATLSNYRSDFPAMSYGRAPPLV